MVECKIGVIGLPGKWSTELLADAVMEKTGFRLVIDMTHVHVSLNERALFYHDLNLCQLDAIIVKKISHAYDADTLNRLDLLHIAEHAGVKIFSPPSSIQRLVNRLSCTVHLINAGIPMPTTHITESVEEACDIVDSLESTVFKPLYSSKAQGMKVISKTDGPQAVRSQVESFKANNSTLYIQKKIDLGGKDLGIMFLNQQYLGSYARIGKNQSWNTTIESGGRYARAEPNDSIIELAYRAQKPFNLDYTTVDVAETENGAVVFEVSAFGGFRGAHEAMGINVASLYVDHVIRSLG